MAVHGWPPPGWASLGRGPRVGRQQKTLLTVRPLTVKKPFSYFPARGLSADLARVFEYADGAQEVLVERQVGSVGSTGRPALRGRRCVVGRGARGGHRGPQPLARVQG